MIKALKYYQGCTPKELFRYIIYHPLRNWFYTKLYSIWIPNEVTVNMPLSYCFKILSKSGFDYSRKFPIIKYNQKTKTALVLKIDGNKILLNDKGKELFDIIHLPDSYLKFVC